MKIAKLYFFLFFLITLKSLSQSTCSSASAFCANNTTGSTFPAGVNNGSAAAGPDYGCLLTQPNPAWYYFQVSQSGTIIISIGGTGGSDVDFICWGPFTSSTGSCGNLTASNTVDCSFSASATETCTINNAIAGEYYQLLLTNYSNQAQNINFNQTGGTGSSNCGLIAPVTSATVCAASSATISANTNLINPTFVWQPGGLTTQTIVVSPSVTTVYTVTVNGLDASSTPTTITNTGTVTISPPSAIAITPSLSTICTGQTTTLTSSGTGPFSWTASSGANPPSTASIAVSPSSTTSYTVLSGTGTCTASAVATVSISSTPAISITPSLSTICSGQNVALSTSGAAPFTWTASSGANPPGVASVTVSPSSTTTYSVLSGSGTCTASAVATVSVISSPSVAITPSLSTICVGQSVALSASGAGPFTWTASSGANPSAVATVTVSPTSTTSYTVLSGTGSCTASAVATVSISTVPSINITPSNTTICLGQSVSLSSGGAAPFTWTASSGTNPPGTASITVSPTVLTTYTVLSGAGTCTASASATVNVISPSASITPSSSYYCLGVPPVSLTASGATTYSWSGNDLSATSGAVVTATPSATGVYTVTGTISGCSATQTVLINVPPISTITAVANPSVICVGMTSTLSASGVNSYSWTPGAMTSGTTAVSPAATNQYTVMGQTLAGCFGVPAVVTVSVVPAINPVLSASSSSVCTTNTVLITAPSSTATLTYTWQPLSAIQGTTATNASSIVAMPTSSANVIYTVTISNGVCTASDTILLKVKTPPTNNHFITLNNDTVCVGGCVTFSATTTGSQPMTYKWYYESGVGTSSVGVAPEACYPAAGTFSVMSIASNICGIDTVVQSAFVTVYDMPVLTVSNDTTINIGESGQVFASGGLSYQWYPNDGSMACSTCSFSVVHPTVTTQYIVVASNSPYCRVQDTVVVTVDVNCGDFFVPNAFSPNGDGLNDLINVHGRCIQTFNLQIFNRWGEKVFETSSLSESWDGTFRGQKLDTGVFVYKADGVSIDGQSFKMKGNITLIR
ncbi:MAG: gliding motility-associated C-terminal domain-containing protein [Bacteroidetes bacterium]|nr:gliding motility-associated C-terminal domain-containing protein [Bacteroidota bacterium]